MQETQWRTILGFFPGEIRICLGRIDAEVYPDITELRMRVGQPIEIVRGNSSAWLTPRGTLEEHGEPGMVIDEVTMTKLINSFTSGSFYAMAEELTQGYLALPGGHRVGFTGHIIQKNGKIQLIRNISSINFRIARACTGIAESVLPYLWRDGRFQKTLILAPPACGKTTLLREIIRRISDGVPELGMPGLHVGVVDERSELAGSYQGVAQLDVGRRTDVLDACPKRAGVYILLRAMNPMVIATDEIGAEADFQMLEDITNAGVSLLATVHALNLTEALGRPGLRHILEQGSIERLIFLSNQSGIGTVESIQAGCSGPVLYSRDIV